MRVTGQMQNIQLLRNLRNINADLLDKNNKLSTGQRINRPGDDPVGIGYQMRYDTELLRSNEFMENVKTGSGMLRTMDSLMQQASDVLKRARVLTQQASTGTVPAEVRKNIAAEMQQLKEQMVMIGNSNYNGRFLFNGQKTDQPPYTSAGAAGESTDPGVYFLNVSPSVTVPVSITGEVIFGAADTAGNPNPNNVFKVFDDIISHLNNNEQDQLLADLDRIDTAMDRISVSWAEIGARMNRFELMEDRILDEQVGLKDLRSKVADVSYPEAITELKMKESVLQAALSTGARIMQTTLIDFIR
ncbi:Flagellar hook-associated protein 3 [Paenibacillus sp. CECT 9249]|uniref:flagellar hook-associated protein FlgL n=1 Tax=Paenibacillus sp. CECT 9249 TaxID=2845385 RepID=UPI001E4798BF|nr:flagellar hook-associated protein FlgL [Paenibacillus sp. CECT 9249]CAH0118018.1 Flagellar hook-associated protein 3 [Paenibacillus sp. CECT 9249]